MGNKEHIYTLDITMNNCIVEGLINGFPAYSYNAVFMGNYSYPLNAFLAQNNKLTLRIRAIDDSTESIKSDISLTGSIKEYNIGDISGPEYGKILLEINLEEFDGDKLPLQKEYSFDTAGPSFNNLFYKSEKLFDQELIKDYGLYLINIYKNKRIDLILKEFEFKIKDFSEAYFDTEENFRKELSDFMISKMFPLDIKDDIYSDNLVLTPYCDNRIWHITVNNGNQLITSNFNSEDDCYSIPIYVAKINGNYKVIR